MWLKIQCSNITIIKRDSLENVKYVNISIIESVIEDDCECASFMQLCGINYVCHIFKKYIFM